MFGDDPFSGIEDLFNQLAGRRTTSSRSVRSQSQNLLNSVESRKETILIFDLSGKKITSVSIKDEIEEDEYGEELSTGQKVLSINLGQEKIQYNLPKALTKRKISHTFKNGILEVSLRK